MLFVRKNDTLVRLTFTQCPCGTDEMVPLAQKVANALCSAFREPLSS